MLFLLRPIAWVVLASRICDGIEEEGFRVGFMFCAAAHSQTVRQNYVRGTFPALERKISNMFVLSHKKPECNSQKSLSSLPCAVVMTMLLNCCGWRAISSPAPALHFFSSLPPSCAVLLLLPLFSPNNQSTQN